MAGQKTAKITAETVVTSAELGVVLGLTSRMVQIHAQNGVIHTTGKNAYPLAASVQEYIKFLGKSVPNEEDIKLERARRMSEAQLKASRATIAKMQAEELKGNMHRSEDVAALTEDLIYTIRSALIALPGRLAMDVAAASTPAEASEIIRKEVYVVMRELASYRYNPKKYDERVRERMSWDGVDGDDE